MRACTRTRLLTPLHLLAGVLFCVSFEACEIFSLDAGPGLSFDQDIVAEGEALADFARAQGNTASVAISGRIVGKLPCDQLGADVKEGKASVDITITLDAGRNACNGLAPTTWAYVVNIVNIPAGDTDVRVRYEFRGVDSGISMDGIRLDTTVAVR